MLPIANTHKNFPFAGKTRKSCINLETLVNARVNAWAQNPYFSPCPDFGNVLILDVLTYSEKVSSHLKILVSDVNCLFSVINMLRGESKLENFTLSVNPTLGGEGVSPD